MWSTSEVVCVATGAIRSVAAVRPVKGLIVITMTVQAANTGIVSAGEVAGGVAEADRGPVAGVVAFVALHAGDKVAGWFSRSGTAVVTVRAGTGSAAVIKTGR